MYCHRCFLRLDVGNNHECTYYSPYHTQSTFHVTFNTTWWVPFWEPFDYAMIAWHSNNQKHNQITVIGHEPQSLKHTHDCALSLLSQGQSNTIWSTIKVHSGSTIRNVMLMWHESANNLHTRKRNRKGQSFHTTDCWTIVIWLSPSWIFQTTFKTTITGHSRRNQNNIQFKNLSALLIVPSMRPGKFHTQPKNWLWFGKVQSELQSNDTHDCQCECSFFCWVLPPP